MSYNEIPNILVDSVVLPNKPLSNLEIIDAAQKLSLYVPSDGSMILGAL